MKNGIRRISKIIGLVSLIILVLPSFLFLFGSLPLDQVKWMMLVATLVWFGSASIWMKER